MTEAKCWRTSR